MRFLVLAIVGAVAMIMGVLLGDLVGAPDQTPNVPLANLLVGGFAGAFFFPFAGYLLQQIISVWFGRRVRPVKWCKSASSC